MTFDLTLPPSVVFGRGAFEGALDRIAALGPRLLIVHGRSAETFIGDLTRRAEGARTLVTHGEPHLEALREALRAARAFRPDAVVAVGGGAAIDLGKALAALTPSASDPLRHLEVVGEGMPLDTPPLPLAAVPTTAGTGAEATRNAVIAVPERRVKVSLRDPRMVPALAVVDPALTDGAPAAVALASGLDAVTQVIEPYLSRRANPMTDALCRDAIPRGLVALRAVVEDGSQAARDDLALTALLSGIALANAGLGAVHGLAGVVGGLTGAPHGAVCGRLLVPVLRALLPRLDGPRPAELLGWIGTAYGAEPANALDAFEAWIDSHGLPSLARMGLVPMDHSAVVREALGTSSMKASPVELPMSALLDVLDRA
jgi:alcohol dehydrogenase class IV